MSATYVRGVAIFLCMGVWVNLGLGKRFMIVNSLVRVWWDYTAPLRSEFIIGSGGNLSWCHRLMAWVRPRDISFGLGVDRPSSRFRLTVPSLM